MYASKEKSKTTDALVWVLRWMKSRSPKERSLMGAATAVFGLLVLWAILEDRDVLFLFTEVAHFVGIGLLAYKLIMKKTCVGVSLKTQELTALFLAIRLSINGVSHYDVHTLVDLLTLVVTAWVWYTMRFQLWNTYQRELDIVHSHYVAIPCAVLGLLVRVRSEAGWLRPALWSTSVYIEAVSVLPQLMLMRKNKVVERFVGHYVFAMGMSRFFSCAHWILQIVDGHDSIFRLWTSGLWPLSLFLSEIVQTFILADFCYYYAKSYAEGSGVVRLPEYIV